LSARIPYTTLFRSKAVVEGNVGVVRERPDPAGGPPSRMVGRSDHAVYIAKTGNFELTGNPRVQQGLNTHVATSPDTVMVLNDKGELQTTGPAAPKSASRPRAKRLRLRDDADRDSPKFSHGLPEAGGRAVRAFDRAARKDLWRARGRERRRYQSARGRDRRAPRPE